MNLQPCKFCGSKGICYEGCQCAKCLNPEGYAEWKENNPEEYETWLKKNEDY